MRTVFRTAAVCAALGGFVGPLNPVLEYHRRDCQAELYTELMEGRWKPNDPVERMFFVYTDMSHRTGIIRRSHGKYETILATLPPRGEVEIVAVDGRLRAAGAVFASQLPLNRTRYHETYFDTLTPAEWAAHDASLDRLLTLRWLKRNAGRVVARLMFELNLFARSGR